MFSQKLTHCCPAGSKAEVEERSGAHVLGDRKVGDGCGAACLPRKAKDSKQRDRKRPQHVCGRQKATMKKDTGRQKNWGLQGKPGSLYDSRREKLRENPAPWNIVSSDHKALGAFSNPVTYLSIDTRYRQCSVSLPGEQSELTKNRRMGEGTKTI